MLPPLLTICGKHHRWEPRVKKERKYMGQDRTGPPDAAGLTAAGYVLRGGWQGGLRETHWKTVQGGSGGVC